MVAARDRSGMSNWRIAQMQREMAMLRQERDAAFERGRASYRAEVEAAIRAEIEWWNSEPATKELSDTEVGLISTALSSVGATLPATEPT